MSDATTQPAPPANPNLVTLADGSQVILTPENWRDTAKHAIDLEIAKRAAENPPGIMTASEQSAVLQAFQQIASQPTFTYTYGPQGAVPNDNGASAIINNPLARASETIMDALPASWQTALKNLSNTTVQALTSSEAYVESKLPSSSQTLSTLQLVALAAIAIGGAYALGPLLRKI